MKKVFLSLFLLASVFFSQGQTFIVHVAELDTSYASGTIVAHWKNKQDSIALATALAGKAALSHTHTFGQITGSASSAQLAAGTATDGLVVKMVSGTPTWAADQTGSAGTGITSLNGDNSSSQTFQIGTSGTDFNIVTNSGVHTFNQPTVSGSNRGVVTPTLYNAWNAKPDDNTVVHLAGAETITGSKRFNSPILLNNSGRSWGTTTLPAVVDGGLASIAMGTGTDLHLTSNAYYVDGVGWKYIGVNAAINAFLFQGGFFIRSAPLGTVDGNITWLDRFSVDNLGKINITAPATSSSGYDILTRNSSNGDIEKVPSSSFAVANSAITGATKTKITYDSKGLVTAGADATTDDITEGSNQYFTQARVRSTPLTGFSTATSTAVVATDDVITGFGKLQAQINGVSGSSGANALGTYIVQTGTNAPSNAQVLASLSTGLVKVTTTTGVLSTAAAGTDYVAPNSSITGATKTKITYDSKGLVTAGADATTSDIAEGSNQYFTQARVRATPLTGFVTSTSSAVVATDDVVTGFGKLQAQINGLSGGVSSIALTFPAVFQTPVNYTNSSGAWTGQVFLQNQSAYTVFCNSSSGSGTPTFTQLPVNAINTSNSVSSNTYLGGDSKWHSDVLAKGISIIAPTSAENATVWFTPVALTITGVQNIVAGTNPSVTYVVNYGSNRATSDGTIVASTTFSGTGTNIFASGAATLNTTSIPANSFIWVTTSATSGTVNELNLTINYRQ